MRAALACHAGMAGNAGGRCVARQMRRRAISARIVSPIDLCRLNALTRGPTGSFGISCILHPNAICPKTATAMIQCSAIAVVVYRAGRSESGIDRHSDEKVALRRRFEVAAVGVADDYRAGIVAPGKVIEAGEFSKGPLPCALLESGAEIADGV